MRVLPLWIWVDDRPMGLFRLRRRLPDADETFRGTKLTRRHPRPLAHGGGALEATPVKRLCALERFGCPST